MEVDLLRKLINKMFSVIKPPQVSDIEYSLEPLPIRDGDEFYMSITYIVPDDSDLLKYSNNIRSNDIRFNWNKHIKSTIKQYFGVNVIINSTGIRSQSYHNKLKQYE
jgi:hypothetical protein